MTAASDRLETVAIAYSQAEIAVLYSFLEGHGIWTVLHSYGQVAVAWHLTLALGGVRFQVREDDAPAARALLAEIEQRPFNGRLFTGHWAFDLLLAIVLLAASGTPPPARVPAVFIFNGRSAAALEA